MAFCQRSWDAPSDPWERGTAVAGGSVTRDRVNWREGISERPSRRSSAVVSALVVPALGRIGVGVTRCCVPGFTGRAEGLGSFIGEPDVQSRRPDILRAYAPGRPP